MKIYHYNKFGLYTKESDAAPSPLEKDKFLIPAYATNIEPPECKEGEGAFFEEEDWVVKPDLRGEIFYTPEGKKRVIVDPGVDVPENCIQEDPPSEYHKTHDGRVWIEDVAQKEADQQEKAAQEQQEKALVETEAKRQTDLEILKTDLETAFVEVPDSELKTVTESIIKRLIALL